MSTAATAPRLALNAERRFFSATALTGLAVTVVGFAPTWFLMRWSGAPPLPWLVHIHGAVYTAWIGLYLAQTTLIATGQRDLHRKLGQSAIAIAVVMVVLGYFVAIEGARRGAGPPGRDQLAFLTNPLSNILTFTALLSAAIYQRHRAPYHKRLMLLTMLPILTTPLARLSRMLGSPYEGFVGGMLLADLFLVALAVYDIRTKGRLHPATLWGGSFLLASEAARVLISGTQTWRTFAAWLIA